MKRKLFAILAVLTLLTPLFGTKQVQAHKSSLLAQNEFEHRYVIFLNGVNSQSSENKAPLDGKFVKMQKELEKRGMTNFVYFSYSGVSLSNPRFCEGWGKDGCAEGTFGQLSSLELSPEYSKDDTHLSVDLQADTLNWLIGEIVRVDQDAEIYLIGFSLGGIISSHWASRINLFDFSDYVKGIVIINSPVGGIPMAGPMLEGCKFTEFICTLWKGALLSTYGETVLSQLQLPVSDPEKSIIGDLSKAAQKFPMTSIQSAHDYTVNSIPIPLCSNYLCTSSDKVSVGEGAQFWSGIKVLDDEPLGGIGLAESPIRFRLSLTNRLSRNHNDTLQNDQAIKWVTDAVAGTSAQQTPPIAESGQHYIIFLHGITSSSSEAGPPLNGDFKNIEDRLRGKGISNFVYFSYAAATAIDRGELMCAGWGSKGCAGGPGATLGDLASLNLSPKYEAEDTKVDIDRQAEALEWLIGQIVQRDQEAKIDIIGFSLGGIVAARWGSRPNGSNYYDKVHAVITLGSPLGGIPLAGAFLDGCNVIQISCQIWKDLLLKDYGEVVAAQLQLPMDDPSASILDDLRGILKNKQLIFASIQSTDDYTVNGRQFPLCRNLACTGYDGVLIGYGSQLWASHIFHRDQSLGGLGIPKSPKNISEFKEYLKENHSATLHHGLTAQWIEDVISTPSKDESIPLTVTPTPTQEVPLEGYNASGTGFAYDIVQSGEIAHLDFQVTNSGQAQWSGLDFKFSPVSNDDSVNFPSVTLNRTVNAGETLTLEIEIPDISGVSVKTIEYQMTYKGEPFGNVIKGYIFILPDQVKDMEDEIRKKIDELIQQGEQEVNEIVDRILEEIQKAIEREARRALEEMLRQCLGANSIVVTGAVLVYLQRKSRFMK